LLTLIEFNDAINTTLFLFHFFVTLTISTITLIRYQFYVPISLCIYTLCPNFFP